MRPEYLSSGEVARLIPAVSESNKEVRLLSPVLSALKFVPNYARKVLSPLGVRLGSRATIECYVEVVFRGTEFAGDRPDGLIIINTGKSTWRALIEVKYGKNTLDEKQVARYLELAKKTNIDAVITISNEFTAAATHSPVKISANLTKKVDLFHLSWSSIRTAIELLISAQEVDDPEQALVLSELHRYLYHDSSGIDGFRQMNSGWRELTKTLSAGGKISRTDTNALSTASDWMQEQKDLCLILSREIQRPVSLKLPKKHKESQENWQRDIAQLLVEERVLRSEIEIPDAASPVLIQVLVASRVLIASMKLKAPADRKTTSARVNWVVRQLSKSKDERITLRIHWPSRKEPKDIRLSNIRENSAWHKELEETTACNNIEVLLIEDIGGKFGGNRTFIESTEQAFKDFYNEVGQFLRGWQAPAPKPVKLANLEAPELEEDEDKSSDDAKGPDEDVPENLF